MCQKLQRVSKKGSTLNYFKGHIDKGGFPKNDGYIKLSRKVLFDWRGK